MEILKRELKLHLSTKLFTRSLTNLQINLYSRVLASFFSTVNQTQIQSSSSSSFSVLCHRIERIRDPAASVLSVLEQWVTDGNDIYKRQLQDLICLMKDFRRFKHALEISHWMTDRRYFTLSPSDAASRLNLVHRVYGSAHAEKYFNELSGKLKTFHVYGALLNVYVQENFVQKAEAIMQEMREKGMATSTFPYNILINLYWKTGDFEKIDALIHEMERNGIHGDKYTMMNLMAAYAATSNISGMERILNQVEKNPHIDHGWKIYSVAASGYLKVGSIETALTMLRKMEEMMPRQRKTSAFNFLLSHYGQTGKKDELYRVWNKYKSLYGLRTIVFCCMIESLSKLDDIEGAEQILEEWESKCTVYDFRVLNSLLVAYCKKGLFERAEAAVEKAAQGRKPYASTWTILATGYAQENQMSKAVEMLKRAILVSRKGWKPNPTILTACLDYLEVQGDVEEMEEIVKSLKSLEPLTRDLYHRLKRTYIAAGKSTTDVLDQMKKDNFPADEDMEKDP